MTHEALPRLGFPPPVDLANTVMVTPAGELDLLEDEGQLREWIAAERDRIAGVEAASGRLPEVRALRETVRELLHARERRAPSRSGAAAGQRNLCLGAPQGRADGRGPGRRGARRARYLRPIRVDGLALGSRTRRSRRGSALRLRGSELRNVLSARSPTAGLVLEGLRQPRAGRPACRPAAEAERATGALRRKTAYATRTTRWSGPSRANVCGAAGRDEGVPRGQRGVTSPRWVRRVLVREGL